ncbi:MAG: PorT family protein [Chitinophagales bacterium]|nr:PorT family protein [Chitinophagales bacterium]
MHITHIWNQHYLRSNKIILFFVFLLPIIAQAQDRVAINDAKFKKRFFHFGIHVGFNVSDFKIRHNDNFTYNDSILGVNSKAGPGFNLSILGSIHLSKNFEFRVIPGVAFAEKYLVYDIREGLGNNAEKKLESIIVEAPMQIKFKSDPIRDFKVYAFAGMKYGYDMASNSKARRAEDLVKLSRHDWSVDYGVGFEIHFPLFILAPEFKVSNGLINVHVADPNLSFSNVIGGLRTRMFLFSINFEG